MVRTRSQRTITHLLPRDLLSYCLEFLPLEELHPYTKDAYRERAYVDMGESHILWKPPAEAKRVSKGFRSAARYALTKGRWRPLKLFCEQGLAAVVGPGSAPPAVPDQMKALFREVWSLEPCGVIVELCMLRNFRHWRYRPVHSFLDTVQNDWQDRGVADSVVAEIQSFRIWGPALWDASESATDEIDVPRDYVPAATA